MIIRYNCKMKTLLTLILLSVFQIGLTQDKPTTLTFKEFGWTISIPGGYKKMETDQEDMLFAFETDQAHNIQAYWEAFDEKTDGKYVDALRSAKNGVNDLVNEQLPGSGTMSESEITISGKTFTVFTTKVTLDATFSVYTVTYARVFGKKALSINVTYAEDSEGQKMIEAVKN